MSISIRQEIQNGVVVIRPEGSLGDPELSQFDAALLEHRGQKLVIDLSEVDHINSQGIAVLLTVWRRVHREGGEVILCGLRGAVKEVCEVTQVTSFVPTEDNVEAALDRHAADAPEASAPLGEAKELAESVDATSVPDMFTLRKHVQDLYETDGLAEQARLRAEKILEQIDWIVFDGAKNVDEIMKAVKNGLAVVGHILDGTYDESADSSGAISIDKPDEDPELKLTSGKTMTVSQELLAEGVSESLENCDVSEEALLKLEENPDDMDSVNTMFRAFHSIKGFAGFVGSAKISRMAHLSETMLDDARNGKIRITGITSDTLLNTVDSLRKMLNALVQGETIQNSVRDQELLEFMESHKIIHAAIGDDSLPGRPEASDRDKLMTELQEDIAREKLLSEIEDILEIDDLLTEDEINAPPVIEAVPDGDSSSSSDSSAPASSGSSSRPETKKTQDKKIVSTVRLSTDRLDVLVHMIGELVIAQAMVAHHPELVEQHDSNSHLIKAITNSARITKELQDAAMSLRMVPLEGTFKKMARLVRDTAKKINKEINFVMEGSDTEIDRSLVEIISEPLVHMVRNSADHGIEHPEAREIAGKPREGTVTLAGYHESGYVVIELTDDGNGLDADELYEKAVSKGLIEPDEEMSRQAKLELIMMAGFSTAASVTDLSGRGVGMDVVRTNIERINGSIGIESELGKGTTVKLRLPLTLAIIEGMLVQVGDIVYTIPLLSIRESIVADRNQITVTANGEEYVKIRENIFPVLRLHAMHQVQSKVTELTKGLLILLENQGNEFCLFVDTIVGQQQVVVKPLSKFIGDVRGISSCSILPNGDISLILDVASLYTAASAGSSSQDEDEDEEMLEAS